MQSDIVQRLHRSELRIEQGINELCGEAAAEITRLTEALRAAEKLLAEIKCVSDVILAPICAASGRYIYDWADCPDMIEELYSEDVRIPAKAFHDLYMATNYDIAILAQALAGAKPC